MNTIERLESIKKIIARGKWYPTSYDSDVEALDKAIAALKNEEKLEKAIRLLAEHLCGCYDTACQYCLPMEKEDVEQVIAECKRAAGIKAPHV